MATRLPSTGMPGCDTKDMLWVHGAFRLAFDSMPDLVRSVPDGDIERARVVSGYVNDMIRNLHEHHTTEDQNLWDLLAARAPACAAHVDQMRAQHAAIGSVLMDLEAAVPTWVASGRATDRDQVVDAIERVRATLYTHLGDEEKKILPVAGASLTQSEWNVLGQKGRASIPKNKIFVSLGYMMRAMDDEQRADFYNHEVPGVVRVLWTMFGKRQFEAEYRKVFQSEP